MNDNSDDDVSDELVNNVQDRNEQHLKQLVDELEQWQRKSTEMISDVVRKKIDELQTIYENFDEQSGGKSSTVRRQISNERTNVDREDYGDNIHRSAQSNILPEYLHMNTIPISRDELEEKIQIEYVQRRQLKSQSIIRPLTDRSKRSPIASPINQRKDRSVIEDEDIMDEVFDEEQAKPSKIATKSPVQYARRQIRDITKPPPSMTIVNGSDKVPVPVLVAKDRDVINRREQITEYSIDSLHLSPLTDRQVVRVDTSQTNSFDPQNLIEEYKTLPRSDSSHRVESFAYSDSDENPRRRDEFRLQQFDHVNYSVMMLREYQSEYHCLASSRERNELILFNSKLNILIILEHEINQTCRHRFYLKFPSAFSSHICDITTGPTNDQFIIIRSKPSRLYLFERNLLSVTELGSFPDNYALNRAHCHGNRIYCIFNNRFLQEYKIDERRKELELRRSFPIKNPNGSKSNAICHLLDVCCDDDYLVVVYGDDSDAIRLQGIRREDLQIMADFQIGKANRIERSVVRVEPTPRRGSFIYLNGTRNELLSVDFERSGREKVTSRLSRHIPAANVCFLHDKRLVLLHQQPNFLSIHGFKNPQ